MEEMGMKDDALKIIVRERYAQTARGIGQSCCSDSSNSCCQAETLGYDSDQLGNIPAESILGLGCGNPLGGIELREGWTVLDLGSGAGIDCFIAARSVGESGRVIGIDMTPEMIDRANTLAEKAGITNVEFRLGEIEKLPVGDSSVDVIISNCVINLSPDKQSVFREAFRVLKPGGKLAISDILAKSPIPENVARDPDLYTGCIAGAVTEDIYRKAIESAGFEGIGIRTVGSNEAIVGNIPPHSNTAINVFSAYITAYKPDKT
jgi:arsenite methyltransferase